MASPRAAWRPCPTCRGPVVCAHPLHHHLLSASGVAPAERLVGLQDSGKRPGHAPRGESEVQESGARDLHRGDPRRLQVQTVGDFLGNLPGRPPQHPGLGHGHVGGQVPVLRIPGPLQENVLNRRAHLRQDVHHRLADLVLGHVSPWRETRRPGPRSRRKPNHRTWSCSRPSPSRRPSCRSRCGSP